MVNLIIFNSSTNIADIEDDGYMRKWARGSTVPKVPNYKKISRRPK